MPLLKHGNLFLISIIGQKRAFRATFSDTPINPCTIEKRSLIR
jgi:hypothetical protein